MPEQIFDGRFTRAGDSVFFDRAAGAGRIVRRARPARARDIVMTEIGLVERARFIGGARYEDDQLTVNALSTLGSPVSRSTKNWKDVLPSLALNVQLDDAQQLRFSGDADARASRVSRARADHEPRRARTATTSLGNDELQRTRVDERRSCAGSGIRAAARS